MSGTSGDGLVRRGANEEGGGLSDSKIESARRFLYDEDDSFSSMGDSFPVSNSIDLNTGSKRTIGYGRTNLSSSSNNNSSSGNPSRSFNTILYHSKNLTPRGRKILMATAAILVVIGLASMFGKGKGSETIPQKHLHGPRLEQFQSTILELGITSEEDLADTEKAQYHALQWVANADGAKLRADDPLALQRYVLAIFFYETSGLQSMEDVTTASSNWVESSNWLSDSGICSWYGVVCEGDSPIVGEGVTEGDKLYNDHHGLVQTLELPSNELQGSIPSELSALTSLYKLDLSHNYLVGSLPKSLAKLTGLRSLVLRSNHLKGKIPKDYTHELSNLRELILAENELQGALPSGLEHMIELRILDLGKNHLTGSVPGLEDLKKLRHLSLEDNQFKAKFPESVTKLSGLLSLNLSKNHFTGVLPPGLSQLTRLEKLNLRELNLMGSIPHELFNKVTRLTELGLSDNSLTGQIPTSIGHLRDLHGFYMGENKFSGTIPRQVGLMSDLTFLELQGNDIGGTIPNLIVSLNALEHMSLGRNQLTGTIPKEIGNLHRLLTLFLEDNQFQGDVPSEIGNLQNLKQARLYENDLEGTIPQEICDLTTDEELVYLGADCESKEIECDCCTKCF